MIKRLRFAAVPLIAGTIIALTTASGWAFSQQTVAPNGNYNFNYSNPDYKAKLNDSTNKSDPNGSGFHFYMGSGQTGAFGFHGSGDNSHDGPPDYYSRPLGNGN
jgi:hypothetical protein